MNVVEQTKFQRQRGKHNTCMPIILWVLYFLCTQIATKWMAWSVDSERHSQLSLRHAPFHCPTITVRDRISFDSIIKHVGKYGALLTVRALPVLITLVFQDKCFPCAGGVCPQMGHYADKYPGKTKELYQTFYLNTGDKSNFARKFLLLLIKFLFN